MISRSTDGKQRVLSLSYGKDSMACLGAIEQLGWPLDRIITADVWATDTIPADLPPMVEFKQKADAVIKERYEIDVEHVFSISNGKKLTYEQIFYTTRKRGNRVGQIIGFPMVGGCEAQHVLKMRALNAAKKLCKDCVQYIGIASDEPNRFHNLNDSKISPLVEIGWTEADAKQWCIENDLLSPIYTDSTRGGCWFCQNQGAGRLRSLRKNYPELWALLLKWDNDSPVTFHADGHTVHDFDERFRLEDEGIIQPSDHFRWSMVGFQQLRLF